MRRRRRRAALGLLAAVTALAVCFFLLDAQVRPLVQAYGQMSARRSAMLAVHTGVERALAQDETSYRRLILLERDAEGRVLSAETDVAAVNRLKAAASNAVMAELAAREQQTVRLPLGNLIGGSFFTGRGPFLPIDIHTSGTVITTLTGEFTDAGINQTRHSLYLDMKVMMTAALPMERVGIELETRFLVCETVLLGSVPQTMLQVELGDGIQKFFGASD